MSWKTEAKEVLRSKYGAYCKYCKDLKLEPTPYSLFTLKLYNSIRGRWKKLKATTK